VPRELIIRPELASIASSSLPCFTPNEIQNDGLIEYKIRTITILAIVAPLFSQIVIVRCNQN
jgi:hypothetical protein